MLEYQQGTCFYVLGRRWSEKRLHEKGTYDVSAEGWVGPLARWGCVCGDRRGERAVQCSGQKGEHGTRPRREARAFRESRWRSEEDEEEGKKWQLVQGVSTKIRRIIGAEDTGKAGQVMRSLGGHHKGWRLAREPWESLKDSGGWDSQICPISGQGPFCDYICIYIYTRILLGFFWANDYFLGFQCQLG